MHRGRRFAGHVEVFSHRQVREDPAILRHKANAQLGHTKRRLAGNVLPLVQHLALPRRRQPHNAAQRRGFADAIAAQQTDALALTHLQRDPKENLAEAIRRVDLLDGKNHTVSPR
jgi:hypothetical protein